jgi:hypothetical protein
MINHFASLWKYRIFPSLIIGNKYNSEHPNRCYCSYEQLCWKENILEVKMLNQIIYAFNLERNSKIIVETTYTFKKSQEKYVEMTLPYTCLTTLYY